RARLETAIVGADAIVVQGGINDVVHGRSVELAAPDRGARVRRSKELAEVVLLPDVLPWNNGWPEAEPRIRELNALIAVLAETANVALLPSHDDLQDAQPPRAR